jgi:hypothetical protein
VKIRRWRYKRERRAPHSSFMSFSLLHLELCSLDVLRVLSKQTLEISKEVKDSSVPDPSLVKVVKDSTLTILFSFRLISRVDCEEAGHRFGGFLQVGRTVGEERVRFGRRKGDLRPNSFLEGFPSP